MNTKETVLSILQKADGSPVSGESLAHSLGVSRAAIHKAITGLRQDGYMVQAATNKGYTLEPDLLSEAEISKHLKQQIPVHLLRSIDSTNTEAKRMAMNGTSPTTAVLALHQTGGKGRLGRSFHAPAGSGIYMSLLLEPAFDISRSVLITTAAAVAVCRALEKVCGVSPQIKWVNDIYVGGKKVCGILTEAVTNFETGLIESLVLGLGINIRTDGFPEELLEIAGAVEGDFSANQLAAQVINEILELNQDLESRSFIDEYRKYSMVIGKTIRVYKGGYSPKADGVPARVLDIDENGGLVVLYSSGQQEVLSSGEISIRM